MHIKKEDVESIISAFVENEKKLNQVKEEVLPIGKTPSRRFLSNFPVYLFSLESICFCIL